MAKKEFYQWVKFAGFISLIPFVLVSGPFAGYFIADFIISRYGKQYSYLMYIFLGIGFISSILETIRIIKLITKIDKD